MESDDLTTLGRADLSHSGVIEGVCSALESSEAPKFVVRIKARQQRWSGCSGTFCYDEYICLGQDLSREGDPLSDIAILQNAYVINVHWR